MSTKSGHVFSSGSWSTLIAEGPVHDLRPSAHSYSDGCSVGTGLLDHICEARKCAAAWQQRRLQT